MNSIKKIYYLSRSYPAYFDTGGGALMRQAQVEILRKNGFEVIVVLPNYGKNTLELKADNTLLIPFKHFERFTYWKHRKGIIDCFLDKWVKNSIIYLKDKINKNDLVFATTGGEFGTLKLGSLLKDVTGCKFIINYHDPIAFTSVNGTTQDSNTNINKDKKEGEYLKNVDFVITSSEVIRISLLQKHPFLSKDKIKTNYFGYLKSLPSDKTEYKKNKVTIVYGGSFANLQQPELLIKVAKDIKDIEVVYIGNHKNYQPLKKYKNQCTLLPAMPYEKYVKYIQKNADIGFMSLTNEYLGACVPSKLFEYINVELPIIGALPMGDANAIINKKEYGLSCHFSDEKTLKNNIIKLLDANKRRYYQQKIKAEREKWKMEHRMKDVINIIKSL